MKEIKNALKVLAGATEKDVENAIDIYVSIIGALFASITSNRKLLAKFVIANRSIIISVVHVAVTLIDSIKMLVPQFEILQKNLGDLGDQWDTKSADKAFHPIEDKCADVAKNIGDRLGMEYLVAIKATWFREENKVCWFGKVNSDAYKKHLNGSSGKLTGEIEDNIDDNNFEYDDLEVEIFKQADRNKKLKVEILIDEDWKRGVLTTNQFKLYMVYGPSGSSTDSEVREWAKAKGWKKGTELIIRLV